MCWVVVEVGGWVGFGIGGRRENTGGRGRGWRVGNFGNLCWVVLAGKFDIDGSLYEYPYIPERLPIGFTHESRTRLCVDILGILHFVIS